MHHLSSEPVDDNGAAVAPRALVVRLEVRIVLTSEPARRRAVQLLEKLRGELPRANGEARIDQIEGRDVIAELAVAAAGDDGAVEREAMALDVPADVLREVRKAKSQARRKLRAPVSRVVVHDTPERLRALELGAGDLLEAGSIEQLEQVQADEFAVEIELAEEVAE